MATSQKKRGSVPRRARKRPVSAILLIHCPDQKGLVAAVADFIHRNNGNILHFDQHVDAQHQVFFMRAEWDLDHYAIPRDLIARVFKETIAERFGMNFELFFSDQTPRMALFVSRLSHCLHDVLARYSSGEWCVEIPVIISNHETLAPVARRFGIDFRVFPKTPRTRRAREKEELALLDEYGVDLVVLARYMQIVSPQFIACYTNRIINIHHSFLPAFPGAKPYHSAYERGVKIIGATSHYVTRELDAGPIIEQDVQRVSHKHAVEDLVRTGRDLEKLVLARAIWYHLTRKVLVYGNRTVVFS